MAKRLLTVLCPSRHELARIEKFQGRTCISARFPIAERSPHGPPGAILTGTKLVWGIMGEVGNCAAEGDHVVTGCPCGTHSIAASWMLTQLQQRTTRKPDVIHQPCADAQPFAPATLLPQPLHT